jgi:putative ABC transport system permease protein
MKSFIAELAYKDGLRQKGSLAILSTCCIIATAALLAILSLKANITASIEDNSKSLLGADFVISSRQEPDTRIQSFLADLKHILETKLESSSEISFASMVFFKESMQSRLVQISAVSTPYPLYGELETEPPGVPLPEAGSAQALLDYSLKSQFNLSVGQHIQLGKTEFTISGFVLQLPGGTETRAALAPRVLIPLSELESTELIKKGSIVRYKFLYRILDTISHTTVSERLKESVSELALSLETYHDRAENLKRSVQIVYRFFDSSTILAFFLGGIGIWSGAVVFLRKKRTFLETLSLLGFTKKQIFGFTFFQLFVFGLFGTLLGAILGIFIQYALPKAISSFTPVDIPFSLSGISILITVSGSLFILLLSLFSAWHLSARSVSPARSRISSRNFLHATGVSAGILLWLLVITQNLLLSAVYFLFSLTLFGSMYLIGYLLREAARLFAGHITNFPISQGIKNLYRPYNQTLTLLLSCGIISFSALFIFLTQTASIKKLEGLENEGGSNLLLFDIQDDQIDALSTLLVEHTLPELTRVPVITMRMTKVKDVPVNTLRKEDVSETIPEWVLTREYRSSWKSSLDESETVLAGEYIGEWDPESTGPVPISVEKGLTEKLDLSLGDRIHFSIQGVEIETYISSIRGVNWQQFKPNFFILFPEGALDGAPASSILLSKYRSREQNARFQNELVQKFGNISAVDLELILQTAREISDKLKNAVFFLSTVIILSALIILCGIIWSSRASRTEENILLRTLGADTFTLYRILLSEYFVLGFLGSSTGAILAISASVFFSEYLLQTSPFIPLLPPCLILSGIIFITVLLGALGARGTLRKGAIEAYRMLEN